MTRFPPYPRDILSRADALLSSKYPDGIVDPRFVEVACEAMMAMTEWQPIETAPKDGTWVLVFTGRIPDEADIDRNICVAQWSDYLNGRTTEPRWMFAWYDGGYYGDCGEPTHWQPLPSPPKPRDPPTPAKLNTPLQ